MIPGPTRETIGLGAEVDHKWQGQRKQGPGQELREGGGGAQGRRG